METGTRLTAKGAAMRNKIVATAADLVLARGVGATTLDDIRAGTGTSKSQLFHYFPGGKADLVKAIALFQAERVFDAQRPHLDELDTWSSWERWREAVVAHYGAQCHWGCPIGAMVSELAGSNPALAAIPKRHMVRWRRYLRDGLVRMRRARALRADVDVEQLSWSIIASLQGGLLLTQAARSLVPLRASLDGALDALRANARRTGSRRAHRPVWSH
jgi:AcrR family transcriptional regulator